MVFEYEITKNGYEIKEEKSQYKVLELENFEPVLTLRYKELLAQKHDLDRAEACLKQMFFSKASTLIDGTLMNTAIQLLVRCFTKSGINDRIKFDENKVFKNYALQIGESDLSQTYLQFYNARNKVISHDELNYSNNVVGITVDADDVACDITHLTVATRYVYEKNRDLLLRLITIASKYCDIQLDKVKLLLIDKYNEMECKPILAPIDSARLAEFEAFNVW